MFLCKFSVAIVKMYPVAVQVCQYYRNERIYLLQCVRTVLLNAIAEDGLCRTFVDKRMNNCLIKIAWNQFESSVSRKQLQLRHLNVQ